MNINEMHISVQHGVDKLNSMQSDLLLPEEIDLELNKNIERFINQKFGARSNRFQEGFEMSQKRIDDLRSLVVETSESTAFKGEVFKDTFVDTINFPNDYLHLINMKSLVSSQKCKKFCSVSNDVYLTKTTLEVHIHSGCIQTANGYDGVKVFVSPDGTTAGAVQIVATSPNGTQTQANLVSWILDPANWLTGVHDITGISSSEVLVTLTLPYATMLGGYYMYDAGGGFSRCTTGVTNFIEGAHTEKRYACEDVETTTLVGMNKFAQHDDIFALLSDPFNKTTYKSPLYTIREGGIDVYTDDTFIVTNCKLTYLKRPAVVDNVSSTTVNCDLPIHTHQEIVQMTVNSILEGFSDPRYQSTSMEVLKSE